MRCTDVIVIMRAGFFPAACLSCDACVLSSKLIDVCADIACFNSCWSVIIQIYNSKWTWHSYHICICPCSLVLLHTFLLNVFKIGVPFVPSASTSLASIACCHSKVGCFLEDEDVVGAEGTWCSVKIPPHSVSRWVMYGQFDHSSLKHFCVPSLIGRGIHTKGWGLLKCFLLQHACVSAFCKLMCHSSLSSTCAGLVSVEFVCVGNCRSTELHKTSFPVEKIFLIT